MSEVLGNVALENTDDELDALAAAARDNPLYPYGSGVERLTARQRQRGWTVKRARGLRACSTWRIMRRRCAAHAKWTADHPEAVWFAEAWADRDLADL
jgi:hypothetical protein